MLCSIVLPLFGRYEVLTHKLQKKLEEIKQLDGEYEIILVVDGMQWQSVPMVQLIETTKSSLKIIKIDEPVHLPAKLFNMGIAISKAEFVIFSTLFGANLQNTTCMFKKMILQDKKQKQDIGLPAYFLKPEQVREGVAFLDSNLYGMSQTTDVLHIDEWCIPKRLWEVMGGFNESPLLQEEFERYAALSFLRYGQSKLAGIVPREQMSDSICVYPFQKRFNTNRDLAKRYAIYTNAVANPFRSHEECAMNFLRDLSESDAKAFSKIEKIEYQYDEQRPHYRVYVIGGYWEYHHNQLGFYNYFETLYGTGFGTYNCGIDTLTDPVQLEKYDLVIFTRCRSENALRLMRYCKTEKIATIYMLDDNWLSAAKDLSEYKTMFVPGNPEFDNFVEALSLCKSTWVYNTLVREDVIPYANNVKVLPISISRYAFTVDNPRKRVDNELLLGFSGTVRWDDNAFKALARIARRDSRVKIILLGFLTPQQECLFTGLDTIRCPMTSYSEYAHNIAKWNPDLLIAPLLSNRTARSKCVNKYVESAVVGAAGIYSKEEPYLSVIKDGMNGFYVEEETEEGWYNTIRKIISDISILRKVQEYAKNDILNYYQVSAVQDIFIEKITMVIEQEDLMDD